MSTPFPPLVTKVLWLLVVCCTGVSGFAQAVSTLIAPRESVPPGSVIVIEWMTVNPTEREMAFRTPSTAAGTLHGNGGSSPVMLRAATGSPAAIPPLGFMLRRYELDLPPDIAGKFVLEIAQEAGLPLRAAIDVRDSPTPPAAQEDSRLSSLAPSSATAPTIVRTFAGRLRPHEPIYFIYGSDEPAAKFQFSFKYRLLTLGDGSDEFSPPTLQFGFTQRSHWDITAASSPFYDTSYLPEVMFESMAPVQDDNPGWLNFLGYQVGYRHESNGRDGDISRSLNNAYARGIWAIGRLDHWHLLLIPEVFGYVGDLSNNPRLKDYRGYGQLRAVLGTNTGPSLMVTTWAGDDFEHASVQLDLTVPVQTRLLDFETYLMIQYFNGYGESLLSYEMPSEIIRAGVSFVR